MIITRGWRSRAFRGETWGGGGWEGVTPPQKKKQKKNESRLAGQISNKINDEYNIK
jgi:hypothetical protein